MSSTTTGPTSGTSPDDFALPRPPPTPSHQPQLHHLADDFAQALRDIRSKLPEPLHSPKVALVCGSGLQGLAEQLSDSVLVPYGDITGFGESTVHGHKSALAFGFLGKTRVPVVCQLGRFHAYEGHDMQSVVYPIRVMKLLGASVAIITNAAGGLDSDLVEVGTVVALVDHVSLPSLTSWNPLIGANRDALGPRFPPLSDAYDFELRLEAFRALHDLGLPPDSLKEGVYAWVAGPSYETRAEQRFLKAAGADCVGMSTVPEVIAARHAGLRVLVLSLVTNMVVATPYRYAGVVAAAEREGDSTVKKAAEQIAHAQDDVANHQEVLDVSARRANDIRALVERIVERTFA
ncbi:hypothetical protein JCM3775_006235 [Rhodotorula graminis]